VRTLKIENIIYKESMLITILMIKERSLVFPGDKLATSEELLPGYGTYDSGGEIISTLIGEFYVDRKKMSAEIKPSTSIPLVLKKGDVAICEVKQITDAMVIVDLLHITGTNRELAGERDGAIHVSHISKDYVSHPSSMYRIGDIIRAKVTQVEPAIKLSTVEKTYGAIKSFCIICRTPLVKKNSKLECPSCERKEERKLADDYGEGNIKKR
jgi:exosome complex component CSL4